MEKIVKLLIKKRSQVIFFLFLIAFYGAYSYYVIPKQENPNTAVAAAVITTVYPGASPEEVESAVTERLEDAVAGLEHVDYYTSMSLESASAIILMYDMDVQMEEVESDLRRAIEDVQPNLPQMCQESSINTSVVTDNQFIISLSGADYTSQELQEYAKIIKDELMEVDGVSSITIDGQRTRQVAVELSIEQMKLYGISIENVLSLLQAQNLNIPSGSISYESGTINVNTPAVFESLRDIENTVVSGASDSLSFVKLKDIADIYIEDVDEFFYKQDGENAILLTGNFMEGKNAVNIGKDVRTVIDRLKEEVPEDINFHEVVYSPEDIDASITDFIVNLLESILLIVIVVMIGVRLRNAMVISVALPMSIVITFIVMNLLHIEFQFISIAALIVSLGILVDNAIVISEEIQQNLNKGKERVSAIVDAVKSTAIPVLTSTLTTMVTFSVIYIVPGAIGKVANTIPTVVIAALTASYCLAMFVIPVLAYYFFQPESAKKASREGIVRKGFTRLLALGLRHRILTIIAAFGTLGIALILVLNLGMQFFPAASKPIIYLNLKGETMSLSKTAELAAIAEDILKEEPLVDHYTTAVGKGLPSFFLTVPTVTAADNVSQVMMQLNEEELEKYSDISDAARHIQALMDGAIAGADVEVKCLEYSIPTDARIVLNVTGTDMDKINGAADRLVAALEQIPGTENVRCTASQPQYQYRVKLDGEMLSGYGLLKYDVVKQLNTSLMGAAASTYSAGGADMDIVVRSNVASLEELYQLPISSSISETQVLLGQVAEVELESAIPVIDHYNGRRCVKVLSDVSPGYSSFTIENTLNRDYIPDMELDEIGIASMGEVKSMMDLVSDLGLGALAAVVVIYVILLLQFSNFKKPFIILSTIPLSMIGCCLGLFMLNMDIQVMALLGVVSLFGIVVNNGILLIEAMDELRRQGASLMDACRQAVAARFRPIMMSSTTTCIGLVPLIIAGDPMTAPMASVLLFGLLFSTVLTMVVVPVLYSLSVKEE